MAVAILLFAASCGGARTEDKTPDQRVAHDVSADTADGSARLDAKAVDLTEIHPEQVDILPADGPRASDQADLQDICIPSCEEGNECGVDGCGGNCGVCSEGYKCYNGSKCVPEVCPEEACDGKECGPDGCGGSCGECMEDYECTEDWQCEVPEGCVPDCEGKECGPDGCGWFCGFCPPACACDDYKGKCGTCLCMAYEPCEGVQCGDDHCGNWCGECGEGETCWSGKCWECEPDCDGKECGNEGAEQCDGVDNNCDGTADEGC